MPKYEVRLPVAGVVVMHVDADSEAKAIEQALQEELPDEFEEMEMFDHISEGNVCNAPLNDAEALLLEEEGADED